VVLPKNILAPGPPRALFKNFKVLKNKKNQEVAKCMRYDLEVLPMVVYTVGSIQVFFLSVFFIFNFNKNQKKNAQESLRAKTTHAERWT
jgi:hypothetical protein